jgi:hypothetical protein
MRGRKEGGGNARKKVGDNAQSNSLQLSFPKQTNKPNTSAMNPDNNTTRNITCTFLDSTVVTVTIPAGRREVDCMVKAEIGRQTGNDPKLLTLLDPATGKRAPAGLTAVVVIINPPPVSKLYRICIASDDGDEQFLIQLAQGQDDEATIVLEWARNEAASHQENGECGDFEASILSRNEAQQFEYYAPGHADYWIIVLIEEGAPDDDNFEVRIVYVPSKSTWHPLLYKRSEDGQPEKITMFSVEEVSRAAVLFEVTTA